MSGKISFECGVCNQRMYTTTKTSDKQIRMELRKFCSRCNKHTIHLETR